MAQAFFRPSRSALYGSPDREAMLQISSDLGARLNEWSNEEYEAEYRRQTSNAAIEIQRQQEGLNALMRENKNDPMSWRAKFGANKQAIREAVLSGVTMPAAKQAVGLDIDQRLASWETTLREAAGEQIAVNTNTDWKVRRDEFDRPYQYDFSNPNGAAREAMDRLATGIGHIKAGYNGGERPVDALPTPEVVAADERAIFRSVWGDYLYQKAIATGDRTILEKANENLPQGVIEDQDSARVFDPDQIGKLLESYDAASKAAEAQANKERTEAAAATDKDIRLRLYRGEFVMKDPSGTGPEINLRDFIQRYPGFDGGQISTLVNLYDQQVEAFGKAKPMSDDDVFDAVVKIRTAPPDQQMSLLQKLGPGLPLSVRLSLLDKITNPEKADTRMLTNLQSTVNAMLTVLDSGAAGDEKSIASNHIRLTRTMYEIINTWDANPDWSADKKWQEAERILTGAKEEAAKKIVGSIYDNLATGFMQGPTLYSGAVSARTAAKDVAPVGLERYWPGLSKERRDKVRQKIAQGIPINRIAEALAQPME